MLNKKSKKAILKEAQKSHDNLKLLIDDYNLTLKKITEISGCLHKTKNIADNNLLQLKNLVDEIKKSLEDRDNGAVYEKFA